MVVGHSRNTQQQEEEQKRLAPAYFSAKRRCHADSKFQFVHHTFII
jgi:hypothetical protein